MSDEIGEVWPVTSELIDEALDAWRNDDPDVAVRRGMTEGEALEEAFLERNVQFVAVAEQPTTFFVEVGGRKVGRLGSEFVGPHPSNDALGIWLNLLHEHADSDPVPSIVLRSATAEEIAEAHERDAAAVDLILSPTQ